MIHDIIERHKDSSIAPASIQIVKDLNFAVKQLNITGNNLKDITGRDPDLRTELNKLKEKVTLTRHQIERLIKTLRKVEEQALIVKKMPNNGVEIGSTTTLIKSLKVRTAFRLLKYY